MDRWYNYFTTTYGGVSTLTLMLHAGAEPVTFDQLKAVETPPPNGRHHPIAHADVVERVRFALQFYEHEVVNEEYGLMPDGSRFFGLMTLKSPYGDYCDTVGLRNSHDKSLPVGIAFGSMCFVCDNTAFIGDHVVKRRHTPRLRRDLPGLVADIIEPLHEVRRLQHEKLERYHDTMLTDQLADHAIMELYRRGVINVQRIANVYQQWNEPEFDWGDRTAWRLFNATTYALTGRVAENPRNTETLHEVIDAVVEYV